MIDFRAAPSPGGADGAYCERCGTPADPPDGLASTLRRTGLITCPSCDLYSCHRCWARASGACPGCGTALARATGVGVGATGAGAGAAAPRPPASLAPRSGRPPTRRRDRSPVLVAVGTVALAVAVVAMINAGPIRPTGGVQSAIGTPAVPNGSLGPSATARSSIGPVAVGGGGQFQSDPTATPRTATHAPVPRATPPPTPGRTPQPTRRPTPSPPPPPTPGPTGCIAEAPQLVGQHWNGAGKIWRDAGFTGAVTRLSGKGNYVIATQDRVAGRAYPCDSSVTVGP